MSETAGICDVTQYYSVNNAFSLYDAMTLRNSGVSGGSLRPARCDEQVRNVVIENSVLRSTAEGMVLRKWK
jgi:hypothetical protein